MAVLAALALVGSGVGLIRAACSNVGKGMRRATLLSVGLCLGFAPAPAPRPPRAEVECKALQGTWVMVRRCCGGVEMEVAGAPQLVVARERMTWLYPANPSEWVVKFHPERKPKALDLKGRTGFARGRTTEAVYALEGDTLTLSYFNDQPRPPDLTGKAPGQWLMVYKRLKR
jgi:uncharacterized protein (TIGR03067 family)